MPARKNVQDAHMSTQLKALHGALIRIASVMNRPRNDERLIEEAGVLLDRALFPLLVGIERLGPIGVVDLSERVGRDYTTVSRQVAKLESLNLVSRQKSAQDSRVREAVVTAEGQAMTDRIDTARQRMGREIFGEWSKEELDDLVHLMTKFVDALEGATESR
ncbi:MarR family transcriptional regulator [Mitsuaria sp. 7]|nr:MarR family transcriptional regulator [Mitsuaria sp. 7]